MGFVFVWEFNYWAGGWRRRENNGAWGDKWVGEGKPGVYQISFKDRIRWDWFKKKSRGVGEGRERKIRSQTVNHWKRTTKKNVRMSIKKNPV